MQNSIVTNPKTSFRQTQNNVETTQDTIEFKPNNNDKCAKPYF